VEKVKKVYCICFAVIFFLASCAKKGVVNFSDEIPLSIDAIAFQILKAIDQEIGDDAKVAIAPFADKHLGRTQGDVELVSKIIETSKTERFRKMSVSVLSSRELEDKEYIMYGTTEPDANGEFFLIRANVRDNKTGDTVITFDNYKTGRLEQKQTKFDGDSPVELPANLELVQPPLNEKQKEVESKKINEVAALHADAERAYGQDNYSEALKLFEQAAASEKGKNELRSYSGVYQSSIKLELFEKAKEAFAKIIAIAMPQGKFTAKFLFVKDSDSELYQENRNDYHIWIEQLKIYFRQNKQCVDIFGHSSRTGSAEYNQKLSEKRAKTIQQWIDLQGRSRTVGKGVSESRSLDGEENVFDRRVEFKPIDCSIVK
jgi:outer membrane protein OmpA-like peptidoglycan-associated protein